MVLDLRMGQGPYLPRGISSSMRRRSIDYSGTRSSEGMTPRPTESTGEFENLSDEAEELCYSSFFLDLCNTYLELAAVMHG